jgi:2-polyprenyl-6-methoxyphenol hydroxylase-like FAD-dependent oxidoreductase
VKVAVVGAGIGGLCLAHGLLRAGADVTVYERDESLGSRGQGYRLHVDAGPALHACLPPDLYELCIATSGRPSTAMTVMTERLRSLRRTEIKPPADPLDPATLSISVNRQTFREILAARLDGAIEFGRTCTGFEQDPGGVVIRFSDGSPADAELLVAADGVNSPIRRRYLPHARLEDTQVACVYGRTQLTGQTRPLVPAPFLEGFTAVVGRTAGLAVGVVDFREAPQQAARRLAPDVQLSPAQPYLMWAVTVSTDQLAGRLDGLSPAELHAVAMVAIRRWHPDLLRLVGLASVQETSLAAVRIAVPVAPWPPSRVTLLGDAVHAMSPAGGSGANTALRDAALLASELGAAVRGEKGLVQAIGDYERRMVDYGFAAVRASRRAGPGRTTLRGALARWLASNRAAPPALSDYRLVRRSSVTRHSIPVLVSHWPARRRGSRRGGQVELGCEFLRRGLAAQVQGHKALRLGKFVDAPGVGLRGLRAARSPAGQRPGDRLADPPGRERGEPVVLGVVVSLHGAGKAEVALLHQVGERHAAVGEAFGDRDNLPEVGLKQAVTRLGAVLRGPFQVGARLATQRVAAFGELFLSPAPGLDQARQFGLLLGGEARELDGPCRVAHQCAIAVVGVHAEPEHETSAPGHRVVAVRVLPG